MSMTAKWHKEGLREIENRPEICFDWSLHVEKFRLYEMRCRCQARIGSFNWSGMQSSKGDWVTPAFELQLSRLDALPASLNQSTQQIRKPIL